MTPTQRVPAGRLIFRLAVAACVILSGAVGLAEGRGEHRPSLPGVYICEGTGADGTPYRGLVEIVLLHEVYVVRWTFASNESYTGIGVVNGDALAVISIGRAPGVAAYTIVDHARLVGSWTSMGGGGRVYPETLTKLIGDAEAPSEREQPRQPGVTPRRSTPPPRSTSA